MKNFRIIIFILISTFIFSSCSNAILKQLGHKKEYILDTGEKKTVRVTLNGAVPEEKNGYKILAAGCDFTDTELQFSFLVQTKKKNEISRMIVEYILEDGNKVILVDDRMPEYAKSKFIINNIEDNHFYWNAKTIKYKYKNKINLNYLDIKLFKFTFFYNNGENFTIYQPSLLPYFDVDVLELYKKL